MLSQVSRSHPVTRPSDSVPGYMEWYLRITHVAVQPPHLRSSTHSGARGGHDDADMHRRRNADALGISTDIVRMGPSEATSLGAGHLFHAICQMHQLLLGDEPGPSTAPSHSDPAPSHSDVQQYTRQRRRHRD